MLPIPLEAKLRVWNELRAHRDFRLRMSDLPGVPFFARPAIGKWTVKVGAVLEFLIGPDPKAV